MSAQVSPCAARAMILAAGRGSRLKPYTDHTPKPLLKVGGHPLIGYGLALLRANGITNVVVNVHHLGDRMREALGDGASYGVEIHYSVEATLLDTGGGIRFARPLLDELLPPGCDDPSASPIVVLNSDVVTEIPIADVLRFHREKKGLATFVLRDDPRAADYGVFGIDASGRVRRFLGEGEPAAGLGEHMFASLQVLDPRIFALMPAEGAFGTMREFYPRLFRAGEAFFGYVYRGPWYTADTAADLERTRAAIAAAGPPSYLRPARR